MLTRNPFLKNILSAKSQIKDGPTSNLKIEPLGKFRLFSLLELTKNRQKITNIAQGKSYFFLRTRKKFWKFPHRRNFEKEP